MTNNELALVAILGAALIIFLGLLCYFYEVKPVSDEQKEASEKDSRPIDTDAFGGDYVEAARRQMNF